MGAPAPVELFKWTIAEQYGWTLEYVESLSLKTIHEYLQIADAKHKARK